MSCARSFFGHHTAGIALVLAGGLLTPCGLNRQAGAQTIPLPASGGAAATAQLPAQVQTQLDKLEDALKAAQAAADRKAAAKTLDQIGALYEGTSNYEKALDYYNQALPIYQALGDRAGEGVTLNAIGTAYGEMGDKQKALDYCNQALPIRRALGDRLGEASTLNSIGNLYNAMNEKQKALDYFNQVPPILQALGDRTTEAKMLSHIGALQSNIGERDKALVSLNQALELDRAIGNRAGEAETLNQIASVHDELGERQEALEYYNQALPIRRELGDRGGEADTVFRIAYVYAGIGEMQKAIDLYNQALSAQRDIGDHDGEAWTLNCMGIAYMRLGENQKALEYYQQAIPIFRTVNDTSGEARTLTNMGIVYGDLGEKEKALENYNQALPVLRQQRDREGEAGTLNDIGDVYNALGEKQKALDFYGQALPIQQEIGDRDGAAMTLNNMGLGYDDLGEPQKALDYYNQALPIFRSVGDRRFEALVLNQLGNVYVELGETQKALDYYNQALPIERAVGDRDGEAGTLNNIGLIYDDLGEKQKALDYYNQALPIERAVGDRNVEGATLNNIGKIYSDLGEKQKALDFQNQALPIERAVGDRDGEARSLTNIGNVYDGLGEKQKALDYYDEALPIAAAISNPLLEAIIFSDLSHYQRATQPALAIFYGKQAVNLLQQVRGNMQSLDKELRSSFVASKEDYYHFLAGLLIAQGRLPEAQQVLDLLKEQEYSDYVRGNTANSLSPLALTPAEEQAERDYQKSTAQLVSLGAQWAELKKITSPTPDQKERLQQLSDQLSAAKTGLNSYYDRLYVLFGRNSEANTLKANVQGNVTQLARLVASMPRTVVLYTMVTSDHYSVIVITATGTVAREYAIPEVELYNKVADFQHALTQQPLGDPRPLALELYKILIGPVQADLDQAKAETLVWSLDGVLRYVPMAALFDGKQYLVENYNTVTITPASIYVLADVPHLSNVNAVAMGISKQYMKDLIPLPAVVGELDHVVKDSHVPGANGVLPGTILLNDQFTKKAMENLLDGRHTVVHIASHFVFQPGNNTKSWLLLAGDEKGGPGGFPLTVEDFGSDVKLTLEGTDLLTLSACDTGTSGNAANGDEVDGLGMTAQTMGAKAVISSLWEVDDESTGDLMADFYKRWVQGNGKVTKVEALRQAQLDLLEGKIKPPPDPSDPTAPTSFTHPYFWAPFVLMGNWK